MRLWISIGNGRKCKNEVKGKDLRKNVDKICSYYLGRKVVFQK